MDENVVKLHVSVHNAQFVKGRASSNDLADTFFCNLFREAFFDIQQILKRASICEFEDAIVVAARSDDFLQANDVARVDHLQEDELSAEGKHALLPVVFVPTAFLKDPVVWSHFARKYLPVPIELPHCRLRAWAKLFHKHVLLARKLSTLNSLEFLLLAFVLFGFILGAAPLLLCHAVGIDERIINDTAV